MEVYKNSKLSDSSCEKEVITFPINNFTDIGKFVDYLESNTNFKLSGIDYNPHFELISIRVSNTLDTNRIRQLLLTFKDSIVITKLKKENIIITLHIIEIDKIKE